MVIRLFPWIKTLPLLHYYRPKEELAVGNPVGKHICHHRKPHRRVEATTLQRLAQRAAQSETEAILIKDSNNITVEQTENQTLYLAQLALEGSLQAIIMLGNKYEVDTKALEDIIQRVKQHSKETVRVINSTEITITQTETQYAAILQQAIELLAQIVVKL